MFFLSLLLLTVFPIVATAQTKSIVCVVGQCLQGFADTNLGVTLSISSNPPVLLLPGEYTSSTQPPLLSTALSYPQGLLSFPSGFSSSSSSASSIISLPLNVGLRPGVLSYPQPLYRGQATFTPGPSQASTPMSSGSFLVAPNTWAVMTTSSNIRIIFWDSAPDVSQLPLPNGGGVLILTDIQSAGCSPPCASPGSCSPSGNCTCPPNFSGQSCEQCAPGFFGPSCQQCPSGCATCDEGITGSGRCFDSQTGLPSSCNCQNGVCSASGCICNFGWAASTNGTACAACAPGFYMTSNGDCLACHSTCAECSDGTGACTVCKPSLKPVASQPQTCMLAGPLCTQAGTFDSGGSCLPCSGGCQTCFNPNPTDCVVCDPGTFASSQGCSNVTSEGVCPGGGIADSTSLSCTGCPAKCTACHIPNFKSISSTASQAQCTSCIPGSILFGGQCISQCPSGTFLTPDGLNCSSCDPSCSSCLGDAKFCRTCSSGQFALNGTCTTTCPPNTFLSGSACLSCHPDCATCSGTGFNQCLTCPSSRPALSSGQCLPVCSRSQFLDSTSSCKSCDSSCASCSGAGPGACLACTSQDQVLRAGTCVHSNCTTGSVSGLGVCLSDLVTGSNSTPPSYTLPASASRGRALPWWQILLITLGVVSIVVLLVVGWHRYAKKWARSKTHAWRHRFDKRSVVNPQPTIVNEEREDRRLERVRQLEEARHVTPPREFDRVPSPVSPIDRYSLSKPPRRLYTMDALRSGNLLRFSTTSGSSSLDDPESLHPMPMDAASRSQPAMYQRDKQNLSIL